MVTFVLNFYEERKSARTLLHVMILCINIIFFKALFNVRSPLVLALFCLYFLDLDVFFKVKYAFIYSESNLSIYFPLTLINSLISTNILQVCRKS